MIHEEQRKVLSCWRRQSTKERFETLSFDEIQVRCGMTQAFLRIVLDGLVEMKLLLVANGSYSPNEGAWGPQQRQDALVAIEGQCPHNLRLPGFTLRCERHAGHFGRHMAMVRDFDGKMESILWGSPLVGLKE